MDKPQAKDQTGLMKEYSLQTKKKNQYKGVKVESLDSLVTVELVTKNIKDDMALGLVEIKNFHSLVSWCSEMNKQDKNDEAVHLLFKYKYNLFRELTLSNGTIKGYEDFVKITSEFTKGELVHHIYSHDDLEKAIYVGLKLDTRKILMFDALNLFKMNGDELETDIFEIIRYDAYKIFSQYLEIYLMKVPEEILYKICMKERANKCFIELFMLNKTFYDSMVDYVCRDLFMLKYISIHLDKNGVGKCLAASEKRHNDSYYHLLTMLH